MRRISTRRCYSAPSANTTTCPRQILAQFAGRVVTVGEIGEFVLTETAFRETHYRRQILKPLEVADPPAITVSIRRAPTRHVRLARYADQVHLERPSSSVEVEAWIIWGLVRVQPCRVRVAEG